MKNICQGILSIAPHIKQAISKKRPVVALQSTIISHGMPYPQNKQCALSIQSTIKKHGAIPATIGIIDGKITVGLNEKQIQRLAYQGIKVKKVSRRDLPYILMTKQLGATTVSSTMIGAEMAGIDIFVTGGIGGVHRGYQNTLDASADLRQLGNTPVAVVSAGVKSILDIPKTLEYLQTQGVPVITYRSQYFPAFFSQSSGIKSPSSLNSTEQIARLLFKKDMLNMKNGVLVAVPNNNPAEGQMIQKAIQQALKQADQQKISGAKITPFLLKRVNQLTSGKSLLSNISLVHNNAQIGSKIAVDLSKLRQQARKTLPTISLNTGNTVKMCKSNSQKTCKNDQNQQINSNNCFNKNILYKKQQQSNNKNGKIIVIGASAMDSQYRPLKGQKFQLYKSCRGYSKKHMGGVGRNIAQVCSRINPFSTTLITPLGNDQYGNIIRNFCNKLNINIQQISHNNHNTAEYLTILDDHNDQMIGISQMSINNQLSFDKIYDTFFKHQLKSNNFNPQNDIVVLDSNVHDNQHDLDGMIKLLQFLQENNYYVVFQCKGKKTKKIAHDQLLKYVSFLRMNNNQYQQLFKTLKINGVDINQKNRLQYLSKTIGANKQQKNRIYSLNPAKSIITNKNQSIKLILSDCKTQSKQVIKCDKILKSTGAGDSLTGTIVSMLNRGIQVRKALDYALNASKLSLQTVNDHSVISDQINYQKLQSLVNGNQKI